MTDGGPKYATFVEQELKAERDRRTSLDARAQSFVTTSGTLVAALAAVGAFVSARKGYVLPTVAQYPLLVAAIMFIMTLVLAILATFNFRYDVASRDALWPLPRERWLDNEETALRNITATNVTTVLTLRKGNNDKATLLLVALFAQLTALASLGLTVYFMVINA